MPACLVRAFALYHQPFLIDLPAGNIALPAVEPASDEPNYFRSKIREIMEERDREIDSLRAVAATLHDARERLAVLDKQTMDDAVEHGLIDAGVPIGMCMSTYRIYLMYSQSVRRYGRL